MTTKNPTSVEEKLDAALAAIETLKETAGELTSKVNSLEEMVKESNEILVAFSQSYYWTPEWQAKEAQAEEEARLGLGKVYEDVEELIEDLNK
ncbi:hypothetical protein GBAR_LOCUS16006 [Geodia barretti]|uniref:Uncharacterized protein n=1 Tax=Geodia barretti TaxID=519541 RepID=A0AA35SGA8_GEOBA|nr:hypothetical protein GBAR_LOCUS16006 [Geodia barretti]